MTFLKRYLVGAFAAALMLLGASNPSLATPPIPNFAPTYILQGFAGCTAAQTFATTSYADVAGCTVTLTPFHNDPTTAGKSSLATPQADVIRVTWNLDVIKATTTTMTCGLYANAALIAASARTIDVAAKNTTISQTWFVANTVVGAQTVKLQCKSGDTATGTLNFGMLAVEEIVF